MFDKQDDGRSQAEDAGVVGEVVEDERCENKSDELVGR